jgi:hypothetical protein
MIPNLSILNREPYHSANSFYNPETLITRLCVSNFDDLKDDEMFIKAFEYSATVIHERVHWLQSHGTSFGCFLGALRLSQRTTTLRMFRGEPSHKIENLLDQRNNNKSILNLDRETQYPVLGDDSDLINIFRQIWFDHQWIHKSFEDSRTTEKLGQVPGHIVGEIIGDLMLTLWDYKFPSHLGNDLKSALEEARNWFSIGESEMYFASMHGMRLTSKNIMEASAVISELQLLSSHMAFLKKSDSKKALLNRIKTIIDSDYGVPIRCFLRALNISLERLGEILPTVSVLCFIALNPPLPPYVMGPPENSPSWNWQDIYPPIRFARLVNCISRFGFLKDSNTHKNIIEYIDEICCFCSLPHTLNMPYPERIDIGDSIDFSNSNQINPEIFISSDYSKSSHNDYIFWVQSRLAEYRLSSLPLLVNLGACTSGKLLKEYSCAMINFDDIPSLQSPLGWTDDDRLGFSCSLEFGNWLAQSVVFDYVLFDVVAGVGKYDLSAFPKEISDNDGLHESLINNIRINLTGSNH